MKRIIVHHKNNQTKMALMNGRRLLEYFDDRFHARQTIGSFYKGRIVNVLPGMQAAFVDIGQGKNAFLYIDDLLPAHLEQQPQAKPSIEELVEVGQELVVQISKEPVGSKGARITTRFTLPGRFLVYMPEADYVGVSRRLDTEAERTRLKFLADRLRLSGEGLIVRTVAQGMEIEALQQDLRELRKTWEWIEQKAEMASVPSEIYRDLDMVLQWIRDIFTYEIDDLVVNDEATYQKIKSFVLQMTPALSNRVKLHEVEEPIFSEYGVDRELDMCFDYKVFLKSGGHVVFDHTEALTVIDVNTGKFIGSTNLEETVLKTNLEAAEEIARLIRLRDIGGIILIDFIDMENDQQRSRIYRMMEEQTKQDRTRSLVLGWTRLGLLEMTRKKVREHLDMKVTESCSTCGGSGRIRKFQL